MRTSRPLISAKFWANFGATDSCDQLKGIHGGYELGRAPEAITLWEVFSLLEADPYMDMCILGNKVCSPESSPFMKTGRESGKI